MTTHIGQLWTVLRPWSREQPVRMLHIVARGLIAVPYIHLRGIEKVNTTHEILDILISEIRPERLLNNIKFPNWTWYVQTRNYVFPCLTRCLISIIHKYWGNIHHKNWIYVFVLECYQEIPAHVTITTSWISIIPQENSNHIIICKSLARAWQSSPLEYPQGTYHIVTVQLHCFSFMQQREV